MKYPNGKPINTVCSRNFPPTSRLLPAIPNFPTSHTSHRPYKGAGVGSGKMGVNIVGNIKLTDLELKVAGVVFGDEDGHTISLAECARRVGTARGWCHRAFKSICRKIIRHHWQNGGGL